MKECIKNLASTNGTMVKVLGESLYFQHLHNVAKHLQMALTLRFEDVPGKLARSSFGAKKDCTFFRTSSRRESVPLRAASRKS